MRTDLQHAMTLMEENNYTCVLCRSETVLTSTQRGIAPLLDWLADGTDMQGFSAADQVVGKAAALLYVLANVKELYAKVMSEAAAQVFADHGISAACGTRVSAIQNRAGTGLCPMEQAVEGIDDPQEALQALQAARRRMMASRG